MSDAVLRALERLGARESGDLQGRDLYRRHLVRCGQPDPFAVLAATIVAVEQQKRSRPSFDSLRTRLTELVALTADEAHANVVRAMHASGHHMGVAYGETLSEHREAQGATPSEAGANGPGPGTSCDQEPRA